MQAASVPTTWLTFREAAAYTKYAQITLRRAIRGGKLRVFRNGRKQVRFRLADLDAWVSGQIVEVR
jgi:excisionase family DNA binding protein